MPSSPAQPGTPLVLVSGSGRSGTSSLAGTLKRLGLHVPQPEVEASETNPRGFYEPQWVIDFHKRHLKELALFNIDSRPAAVDLVAAYVSTGKPAAELRDWLSGQLEPAQVVVKDPHAFWFAEVWTSVSAELGADLRWLTALRHPAEVVGSRDIAYLSSQPDELRLTKETSNVAGWVHAALLTERAGRGGPRAFVRYVDLLADWRSALAPVQQQLDLSFDTDLSSRDHHPVDDFVEPSMRKSQLTWDDVRTPDWLRDTAEEVWQLLGVLTGAPADEGAQARLDEIHEAYAARYADAVALTYDHTRAEAVLAGREAREAQRGNIEQLRRDLAGARQTSRQAPAATAPSDIGGREAARVLAGAVVRRLRRR